MTIKTKLLLRLATSPSLLLAALPPQALQASGAASAAAADLVQFTSGGHILGFTAEGMYAATGSHALHVDFAGANAVQPQSDTPASGQGQVAALGRVAYENLWDGIDLVYTADADGIYAATYNLAPGADPADIRLQYSTPLAVNEDGMLSIAYETGAMTENAPVAWQEIDGERVPVDAAFRVTGKEVTFALGAYDARYAMGITNCVVWNTFLGGGMADHGFGIAVDGSGNVYVTGYSVHSWGSPVRVFTHPGLEDAFVARLDSSGGLVWNTFLGGDDQDEGRGIALDDSGNIYITGDSQATWGTPVNPYAGGATDAFVAKLDMLTGALTWNTFLGGTMTDDGYSIAANGSSIYVTGSSGADWGGAPIRAFTAGIDAFVAKLNSSGGLSWHTFLGGESGDYGYGIAAGETGSIFVTGKSDGTWGTPVLPLTGHDAFVAKLYSSGALSWNTFLGGSGNDEGFGIAVDGSGNSYVTGYSSATWGSPVRDCTDYADAFALKLDSLGGLTWNTFLGGGSNDFGRSMAVDGEGNAYVSGDSSASWGSPQRDYTLGGDAFAAKLDPSGALAENAFLGGSASDIGRGIAVDESGGPYIVGDSEETWGTPVRAYTNHDAFVAKIDLAPPGDFNKLGPADGATGQPIGTTLTWEGSNDANHYEYCINATDNTICDGSWTDAGNATSAAVSGLNLETAYYWQVRAKNALGTTYANGGSATWWTFTTITSSGCPFRGMPLFDFNGDCTTDVAVYRPSTGAWYIRGESTVYYGSSGDKPVPGDYDGDGDTDIAVFRPSTGAWYVQGETTVYFGASGDIPIPELGTGKAGAAP